MTTWEAAQALLTAVSEAFSAAERSHDRQYVSDGRVLFDWTPLLAVEWERTTPLTGAPESQQSPGDMSGGLLPMEAVFSIHSTRDCFWPDEVGTPPTPNMVETSAEVVHADAKLVLETLQRKMGDNSLFGVCGRVTFLGQTAVGPDGGVVGSVTTIAVGL